MRLPRRSPHALPPLTPRRHPGAVTSQNIAGVDDAKDFKEVTASMRDIGITPEQQDAVWALLSGVLWLGNLRVDAVTDDSSKVAKDKALDNAAALLGLERDALAHALTHKKVRAGCGRGVGAAMALQMAGDA